MTILIAVICATVALAVIRARICQHRENHASGYQSADLTNAVVILEVFEIRYTAKTDCLPRTFRSAMNEFVTFYSFYGCTKGLDFSASFSLSFRLLDT